MFTVYHSSWLTLTWISTDILLGLHLILAAEYIYIMDFDEPESEAGDNFLDLRQPPQVVDPDEEFEGECCFWLLKLLRGRNVGRRLKRKVFKYALVNALVGFSLLCITVYEERKWGLMKYFANSIGIMNLVQLQYFVCITALVISVILLFGVYNWASLVTNKNLLQNLLVILMGYGTIQGLMTLYCIVAFFLSFKGVDWENDPAIPRTMLACYIMTIIFIMPYSLCVFLYMLDVSYLSGEIDLRGDISEPEVPEGTTDLSNVTLRDLCGACIALPCLLCLQFTAIFDCCRYCCNLCKEDSRKKRYRKREKRKESSDGSIRGFFDNLYRMIMRPGRREHKSTVIPKRDPDEEEGLESDGRELALKQLRPDMESRSPSVQRLSRQASDVSASSPGKDLKALQQSQTPTLSAHQFKALWGSLSVVGSFQCKLRSAPNIQALTQHLRKQNFHVVFAASPSDDETEISICNIRPNGDTSWFMARFLFSNSIFSAAMKAQNSDEVEGYVRKFALARVLKIDTSSVA